jgi:Domain of unknown function (DUF4345)
MPGAPGRGTMSRRGLQLTLTGIGSVATVAGTHGVLRGGASILKGGKVSANTDSEYRFHATWYAVLGVLVLRAAQRPEHETTIIRACGAGFLLAACSRVLSWMSVGKPHWWFRVLMGLEFAIPAVIIPWHSKVARESRSPRVRARSL